MDNCFPGTVAILALTVLHYFWKTRVFSCKITSPTNHQNKWLLMSLVASMFSQDWPVLYCSFSQGANIQITQTLSHRLQRRANRLQPWDFHAVNMPLAFSLYLNFGEKSEPALIPSGLWGPLLAATLRCLPTHEEEHTILSKAVESRWMNLQMCLICWFWFHGMFCGPYPHPASKTWQGGTPVSQGSLNCENVNPWCGL